MSKDRLLSDEELKEKIDTILENEFDKGFETANEGFGGRDSYNLNKIINFINTQKRLVALEEREEVRYEIMRGQHGHDEVSIVRSLEEYEKVKEKELNA